MATTANLLALYGPMNGAGDQARQRGGVDDVALALGSMSIGRKTRIPWMTPHRLTPSTHSQSAVVSDSMQSTAADPGVVAHQVHRAEGVERGPAQRVDLVAVGHVGDVADATSMPPARRSVDHRIEGVGLDVGQHQTFMPSAANRWARAGRSRWPRR